MFLIAGPTASGKSALALAWAERTGSVIVNADASQVYRDLPVLSAMPSADEMARADHRLFGVRDGADPCSAADYAAMAKAELAAIAAEGQPALLVGGTGLYLRTLLDGIAPVPGIDPAVREAVRTAEPEANRAELEALDPAAAARLGPNDRQRIARALEVVRSTGRTLADWQARTEGGIVDAVDLRPLVLLPPRDWLYARCDARFAAMVEAGAVEEVEALLARGLDPDLPVMRAIGVPEITAWLEGRIDREAMIAAGAQATRRYAKRQYTWFAHQPPAHWPRFAKPLDDSETVEAALALLGDGS